MVKKYDRLHSQRFTKHVKADVIILGRSLPGIVTAHNLIQKFGESVNIVVLDLPSTGDNVSKKGTISVSFEIDLVDNAEEDTDTDSESRTSLKEEDNVTRFLLEKYALDFNIPPPCGLEKQLVTKSSPSLRKLFQHINGSAVQCARDYHEYDFLSYFERIELAQYELLLDNYTQDLFKQSAGISQSERQKLIYYDQTTMEAHINQYLLFSTSKEIMRTIVELVCGVEPESISILFYLHQCFRASGSRNHIDRNNVGFREKLLGQFRTRLTTKLRHSVNAITVKTKSIHKIRTAADEQVILEPSVGETDFICKLLAMALKPDQLSAIQMHADLISENELKIIAAMKEGASRKFVIEYAVNFWQPLGYSGDIFSVRGPILWAIERPTITTTREADKYAAIMGYLKVNDTDKTKNLKDEVVNQLVILFGEDAANPVKYTEKKINTMYVPRLGDYVGLRELISEGSSNTVEWAALDIFGEDDVAASIEAGHLAYLNVLHALRPQALTFDDWSSTFRKTIYSSLAGSLTSYFSVKNGALVLGAVGLLIAFQVGYVALNRK